VNYLTETGRVRPASEHQPDHVRRSQRIQGTEGNFKVTIEKGTPLHRSGQVHVLRGLRRSLPGSLPDEYNQGFCDRKATYKRYAQAIPGAFAIQKADKAPCRLACPAGINVQGYVQMVGQGKYKEALPSSWRICPCPACWAASVPMAARTPAAAATWTARWPSAT
jgi:hypothetical protein